MGKFTIYAAAAAFLGLAAFVTFGYVLPQAVALNGAAAGGLADGAAVHATRHPLPRLA